MTAQAFAKALIDLDPTANQGVYVERGEIPLIGGEDQFAIRGVKTFDTAHLPRATRYREVYDSVTATFTLYVHVPRPRPGKKAYRQALLLALGVCAGALVLMIWRRLR